MPKGRKKGKINLSHSKIEELVKLYKKGSSWSEKKKKLNLSSRTIWKWEIILGLRKMEKGKCLV